MKKTILYTALLAGLMTLAPALASAATITSVTLNGGSSVQVNPGDNIIVSVTTALGANEKWKGIDWGINASGTVSTCSNTRNAHSNQQIDGLHWGDWQYDYGRGDRDDRQDDNYTFTETFVAKAPKDPGLYGIAVMADGKNHCGDPISPAFALPQSIRVGANTTLPTFAPYSDITVQLTASTTGTTVTYPLPTATDVYGNSLAVSCTPPPGSFFGVGNNTVVCNATDSWGNQATPEIFTVSVLLPPDVTPPVISPMDTISVQTTSASGAVVTYATPTATDDRDGTDPVSCTPISGSTFALGTTTVTCTSTDAAGNTATSTFAVGVALTAPADTIPPVISAHGDITVTLPHAASTSTPVTYTAPTATDDVDGTDPVSCTPPSGSSFGLGTTTVTCTSTDAAGNTATSAFSVAVLPFVPQPITLASQPDESYMCLPNESDGWRACYTGGDSFDSFTTNLGAGSNLGTGALTGVTIALDPTYASSIPANPFRISIVCYTDAAYTTPCSNWVTSNLNHDSSYVIQDAIHTTDNKHWTADFTSEENFNGSSPVVFNPADYYQLHIQDLGIGWPAFGQNPASTTNPQPYWVISGVTQ